MLLFALISLIGLVIENGFVYVSDHVFGFHSLLAKNVAKFGLGLPVAGAFRFWTSHVLVFPEAPELVLEVPAETPVENGAGGH